MSESSNSRVVPRGSVKYVAEKRRGRITRYGYYTPSSTQKLFQRVKHSNVQKWDVYNPETQRIVWGEKGRVASLKKIGHIPAFQRYVDGKPRFEETRQQIFEQKKAEELEHKKLRQKQLREVIGRKTIVSRASLRDQRLDKYYGVIVQQQLEKDIAAGRVKVTPKTRYITRKLGGRTFTFDVSQKKTIIMKESKPFFTGVSFPGSKWLPKKVVDKVPEVIGRWDVANKKAALKLKKVIEKEVNKKGFGMYVLTNKNKVQLARIAEFIRKKNPKTYKKLLKVKDTKTFKEFNTAFTNMLVVPATKYIKERPLDLVLDFGVGFTAAKLLKVLKLGKLTVVKKVLRTKTGKRLTTAALGSLYAVPKTVQIATQKTKELKYQKLGEVPFELTAFFLGAKTAGAKLSLFKRKASKKGEVVKLGRLGKKFKKLKVEMSKLAETIKIKKPSKKVSFYELKKRKVGKLKLVKRKYDKLMSELKYWDKYYSGKILAKLKPKEKARSFYELKKRKVGKLKLAKRKYDKLMSEIKYWDKYYSGKILAKLKPKEKARSFYDIKKRKVPFLKDMGKLGRTVIKDTDLMPKKPPKPPKITLKEKQIRMIAKYEALLRKGRVPKSKRTEYALINGRQVWTYKGKKYFSRKEWLTSIKKGEKTEIIRGLDKLEPTAIRKARKLATHQERVRIEKEKRALMRLLAAQKTGKTLKAVRSDFKILDNKQVWTYKGERYYSRNAWLNAVKKGERAAIGKGLLTDLSKTRTMRVLKASKDELAIYKKLYQPQIIDKKGKYVSSTKLLEPHKKLAKKIGEGVKNIKNIGGKQQTVLIQKTKNQVRIQKTRLKLKQKRIVQEQKLLLKQKQTPKVKARLRTFAFSLSGIQGMFKSITKTEQKLKTELKTEQKLEQKVETKTKTKLRLRQRTKVVSLLKPRTETLTKTRVKTLTELKPKTKTKLKEIIEIIIPPPPPPGFKFRSLPKTKLKKKVGKKIQLLKFTHTIERPTKPTPRKRRLKFWTGAELRG